MKIVFVRPKEVIDIVAGMIGLLFDQLDGEMPVDVEMEAEPEQSEDDLTKISGIGPAFARRLHDAGVSTYAELGAMTVQEVRERTQLAEWQGDPDDWISQARVLAAS